MDTDCICLPSSSLSHSSLLESEVDMNFQGKKYIETEIVCVCVCVCVFVCACACVCVHACMYVLLCIV